MIRPFCLLVTMLMSGAQANADPLPADLVPHDPQVVLATAAQDVVQDFARLQVLQGSVGFPIAKLVNIATLMDGVDAIWTTPHGETAIFFAVSNIEPRSTL